VSHCDDVGRATALGRPILALMSTASDRARPDAGLGRLALARRAAALGGTRDAVVLTSRVPALPPAVAAAVAEEWGLAIGRGASGFDAFAVPSFRLLAARPRAQQVLRAVSRRTNLVLPGSRAVVAGEGALATTLARTLSTLGAHAILAAAPRGARLRAHLDGLETADAEDVPGIAADYVLLTGEGQPPADPARLRGVVADASYDGSGLAAAAFREPARPGVRRLAGGPALVVDIPAPLPADLPDADGLAWGLVDLVVATALLVRGDHDVDARLAELAVA